MSVQARPGESREAFLARVIAAAPPPTRETAERLRRLMPLPPVLPAASSDKAA
ncbi:hypothetical protein [Amycolatopsis lurida]|uniref:hypothetical protein n=1 Tax=Amycolatopsis lurida TaxID=31959 RepID=UPI003658EEEF